METPSCRILTEAEIAEQKRQAAEAEEQKRQAEMEEQKRKEAEIAEQNRKEAEIAEQKRQADIAEQKRQAEIEEQKRQAEIEEQKKKAAEIEEQKRQAEIEEKKRQRAEDDELAREGIVNLKDFCPSCKWDASMTCIERVTYLNTKYGIPMDGATANAMKKKSCKIPEDGNGQTVTSDIDNFCPECFWSKRLGVTCKQRVKTIRAEYGISKDQAMLSAMKKKSCKLTQDHPFAEDARQNRQREEDFTLELLK